MVTLSTLGAPEPALAQYFPIESVSFLLRNDRPNRLCHEPVVDLRPTDWTT